MIITPASISIIVICDASTLFIYFALNKVNKVPKNAIKTTVGQPQNGLRKVTKEQNGVSMEYYE